MSQSPQPPNTPKELQIELPANLDAYYANFVIIQHSPSEFVLDFARVLPNVPSARVGMRLAGGSTICFSISVFHSPQSGHLPIHLAWALPQFWQT